MRPTVTSPNALDLRDYEEPSSHTVIFGKNTTEAINKLAYRYPLSPKAVV